MVEVKYMLCLMYGNIAGYQYKGLAFPSMSELFLTPHSRCHVAHFVPVDLPEELLQRKIELCGNILKVYDAIDPGEANQRTNVEFELNCATVIQTKAKLHRNLFKRDAALVRKLSIRR